MPRSTRRDFLKRGAVATAAAAAAKGTTGASAAGENRVICTIVEVTSAKRAKVSVDGETVELELVPGAVVSYNAATGSVADLSRFQPNDIVSVIGNASLGLLEATSVDAVYRAFTGVVTSDDG